MKDTLHKITQTHTVIPSYRVVAFSGHLARPERSNTLLQSILFKEFKDRPQRWHSTTAEPKELAQSCATWPILSINFHQSVAPCYTQRVQTDPKYSKRSKRFPKLSLEQHVSTGRHMGLHGGLYHLKCRFVELYIYIHKYNTLLST